jgi:preprotein translocase subunit YajC
MDISWGFNLNNFFTLILIVMISGWSYWFAAIRTDKKIKESEDKIWEYMKILNRTEPVNTKSGMTRKLK